MSYQFSDSVLSVFDAIKSGEIPKYQNWKLPIHISEKQVGWLIPITRENLLDNEKNFEIVNSLAQWRVENSQWFDIFPVTFEGTKKWLKDQVVDKRDRLLFLIEDMKGVLVGHMGLYRGEADNFIRGRKDILHGGMTAALTTMLDWAKNDLGLDELYLRVFSENTKAKKLYSRCGFSEVRDIPLKKTVNEEAIRWVEIVDGNMLVVDRYFTLMHKHL